MVVRTQKARQPGSRRGVFFHVAVFTTEMASTSPTRSCLHGQETPSEIYRRVGQPDDSRQAVRVVARRHGQEAEGTGLAGRGWQSNHPGARQWVLHADSAQGWHAVLYVEQAAGRGADAGARLPKARPA